MTGWLFVLIVLGRCCMQVLLNKSVSLTRGQGYVQMDINMHRYVDTTYHLPPTARSPGRQAGLTMAMAVVHQVRLPCEEGAALPQRAVQGPSTGPYHHDSHRCNTTTVLLS